MTNASKLSALDRILHDVIDQMPGTTETRWDWVKSDHATVTLTFSKTQARERNKSTRKWIFLDDNILSNQAMKEELKTEFHFLCQQATTLIHVHKRLQ